MEEGVQAVFIIEVLGRPADNVKNALQLLVDQLSKEKEVEILNSRIFEPKKVENANNLFTSFSEIELKASSLHKLLDLSFRYMPASVEIVSPQKLEIKLNDSNILLSDLVVRLHNYDAIAKRLAIEVNILQNKLKAAIAGEKLPEGSEAINFESVKARKAAVQPAKKSSNKSSKKGKKGKK